MNSFFSRQQKQLHCPESHPRPIETIESERNESEESCELRGDWVAEFEASGVVVLYCGCEVEFHCSGSKFRLWWEAVNWDHWLIAVLRFGCRTNWFARATMAMWWFEQCKEDWSKLDSN